MDIKSARIFGMEAGSLLAGVTLLVCCAAPSAPKQAPAPIPTPAASMAAEATKRVVTKRKVKRSPAPERTVRTKDVRPVLRTVTPGAYCSPFGARGVNRSGKTYTCKGPGRNRWRR